ncbi:response regulator [Alteromonas sp. K632G]|uniref:CheY-like receiver protein n=1 Tax=Alteromonas naphthalenivorans TaxID=715451 RepID=F5Z7N4_ALTNA|nr:MULTISPECIES: response regulator [Alteromonas]AEF03077.1 CheY-like receiver protein [Alteromonas naphthalenivorans]MBB66173.1 response regulator [Rickettsiales bacterium]MBO7921431.1 response regulator [Alteromonas sp. K632G]PHS55295.1 MAG: response regulator [Alteromonas sp.]
MDYRIAIVEDNATARTTLRGHLLPIAKLNVSSFGSGVELKSALRKQHFELIIMDYHLGQGRTGVEWVQSLKESGFIRPSTGLIFLTSDRSPQTIGRIMDLQPDALLIKPYTIASLSRQIKHYLSYRKYIEPVLREMDNKQRPSAITLLRKKLREGVPPRLASDVGKLYAKLLFENEDILHAMRVYDDVLTRSDKVLWAQWGKIRCQYAAGLWPDCQDELSGMVTSTLARDSAFEWLASLSFEQKSYEQVETYLSQIKFSDLSLPAARLKSLAYQKQDKVVEAIDLLQKKRAMHRSARDRFNDFTFELAEFYLLLAEEAPSTNREESLSQARKLVGLAGRSQSDRQVLQKRDYLLAFSAILESEDQKAAHLLESDYMDDYLRTEPSMLVIAAKVHHGLGEEGKASQLLALAKQKNAELQIISEQVANDDLIFSGGERLGLNHDQAVMLNETGTQLFMNKQYLPAMKHFYDALNLSPETAAFGLNLLQCMIESDTAVYRKYGIRKLLRVIADMALSDSNHHRLTQLNLTAQANAEKLIAPAINEDNKHH